MNARVAGVRSTQAGTFPHTDVRRGGLCVQREACVCVCVCVSGPRVRTGNELMDGWMDGFPTDSMYRSLNDGFLLGHSHTYTHVHVYMSRPASKQKQRERERERE